ncbi:unnamed protein product, partial [Schistosoma rodhaini]
VECLVKYKHNEYNHHLMLELVKAVNNIEQKYNITYPKSLKWKECFVNESIAYKNMTLIYNRQTCDKLKQPNEPDTYVLSYWMQMRRINIINFNRNF